jgi:hypothetical protein
MSKPAPITILTEPIGGIRRPADLIDPHIETPEEVRDQPLEPGANYRWSYADGLFLRARRDCSAWQPDGVTWLPST